MKAYNDYMDKISVTDSLHRKFVSYATNAANAKPDRSESINRRYAAAFAFLAVTLLGVVILPRLIKSNVSPIPGNSPSVSQPNVSISSTGAIDEYSLVFNKANNRLSADKASIPGHFWQDLTSDELKAVFHSLADTHTITATANFQSDNNGASLFNIDSHALSAAGLSTYIQIAPDDTILDYVIDSVPRTSDVLGTTVTAGYFETKPNSKGLRNVIYFASFKLSNLAYYVELGGAEAEKEALESEVSELIGLLIKEGAADLNVFHPVVPELREDRLSLDEACADQDFGAYIPAAVPDGFVFQDALRFINQEQDSLSVNWAKGMGYIEWRVSMLDNDDKMRITSVENTKNYDLSLYPIPRADSVPDELQEIVDNPIFRSEELTLKAVQARAYEVSDAGDEPGFRMRFSVLYGDTLVEINVKGATPEAVFKILQQL